MLLLCTKMPGLWEMTETDKQTKKLETWTCFWHWHKKEGPLFRLRDDASKTTTRQDPWRTDMKYTDMNWNFLVLVRRCWKKRQLVSPMNKMWRRDFEIIKMKTAVLEASKDVMGYYSKFCILTKIFLHHHTECNRCKHGMCWSLLSYGVHKDHVVYIKIMWCT